MKHASSSGGSDSEERSLHGYLVEVTPGRELLYRTPWAFREAMRIGQITAESRIFHRATSQWISITEHPEYRKFISARAPFSPPVINPGPAAPAGGSSSPTRPADARPAPAPTPPISHKAARIYQRMTSGLTELKRRLETAKPKRSAPQPPPRGTPSPPARAPASKPGPREASKAAKTPPPAEEAGPAPQSPPEQNGPRKRWTFYP
jgi:hypothetical protein